MKVALSMNCMVDAKRIVAIGRKFIFITKITEVSDDYYSELRALRVLRGETPFAFGCRRTVLAAIIVALSFLSSRFA